MIVELAHSFRGGQMANSLCESCVHMQEVVTARSRFLLCDLSQSDPRYAKYPSQPVIRCEGYKEKGQAQGGDER
jgi:hypothetical protein